MTAVNRARRALVASAVAGSLAPAVAAAADQQRYAVLSLVGDRVSTTVWRQPTGSRLDQNVRDSVKLADGALDKIVLLAVDDELRRAKPGARPVLLAVRDPKLYQLQDQMLEQSNDAGELLGAIKGLLAQSQATRLLLVSKHRAEARFQLQNEIVGGGKIAGLGFYLDEEARITHVETGTTNAGYIAPYAYIAVSLIDVASMKPVRRVAKAAYAVFPTSASKEATRAWDALTSKQKVEELERLINTTIAEAMPELLAGE